MLEHRSAIASNDANGNAANEWSKARALDPHGLRLDWKYALAIQSSLATDLLSGGAVVSAIAFVQKWVSAATLKTTPVHLGLVLVVDSYRAASILIR